MGQGDVVVARLMEIWDQIQPEGKAVSTVMILKLWLYICKERKGKINEMDSQGNGFSKGMPEVFVPFFGIIKLITTATFYPI